MVHRDFKAGQTIILEEAELSPYSIVISGMVKLVKSLADGRQQIVGISFASNFLGRIFAERSQIFAEAATDVQLCCFPHTDFERIVRTHPKLEHELLERTLDDLDKAREWMLLLGRKSATEKIASLILRFWKTIDISHCPDISVKNDPPTLILPLTRAEIADYLGMTIETASRNLTKLRTTGVIRLLDARKVEIRDMAELEKLANS